MVITPDTNGYLKFPQYAYDDNGDDLILVKCYLKAIDGTLVAISQQTPGWLIGHFTVTQSKLEGRTTLTLNFSINKNELSTGRYTIAYVVSDGVNDPVECTFDLVIGFTSLVNSHLVWVVSGGVVYRSGIEEFLSFQVTNENSPHAACFDNVAQKFIVGGHNMVFKCLVDGSGKETPWGSSFPVSGTVWGIDVDPDQGLVFIALDSGTDGIYVAPLEGGTFTLIQGLDRPGGLDLDRKNGHVYSITYGSPNFGIRRCDYNGQNAATLMVYPTLPAGGYGISLDIKNGFIYYTSGAGIYRCSLTGQNPTLITTRPSVLHGVYYDELLQKIWYTESSAKILGRCNLDGSNPEQMAGPYTYAPFGIKGAIIDA